MLLPGAALGGEHQPGDLGAAGEADVEAELLHRTLIVLDLAALGRLERAAQGLVRADQETDAGIDRAGQHADLHPVRGSGIGGGGAGQGECGERNGGNELVHEISLKVCLD